MLNRCRRLVRKACPISIAQFDTLAGPRIGGFAPDAIFPPKIYSCTRYFITAALGESSAEEVSLFTSFDYDNPADPHYLYENIGKIFASEDFVQIVVHSKSRRGESANLSSELPGRALEVESEISDILVEPGGQLLLPNKFGGRPYFYYGTRSYTDAINRLFDDEFCLFLQLTWGGYERGVPFAWPFDKFTFHLLAKEAEDGTIIWRYGWG
jgi:hypothetical protein